MAATIANAAPGDQYATTLAAEKRLSFIVHPLQPALYSIHFQRARILYQGEPTLRLKPAVEHGALFLCHYPFSRAATMYTCIEYCGERVAWNDFQKA